MTPRSSLNPSCIRRRAAVLLAALGVLLAQVEVLLPEEHDGDAAAVQLVAGAAIEHEPAPPAKAPVPQPEHTAHVDHCAHAHVFATDATQERNDSPGIVSGVPETRIVRLTSVSSPPHLRPPIA